MSKQGTTIATSDYAIDLFEGPVLAGSRILALGGANLPIARETDGLWSSPAAAAVRAPWSYGWWDQDLDAGITFPNTLSKTDFDNNGSAGTSYSNFVFFTFGGNLQFGRWGVGAAFDNHQYTLPASGGSSLQASFNRGRVAFARSWLEGQLMLGIGFRFASLSIATPQSSGEYSTIFSTSATGLDLGVICGPVGMPFRLAASLHASAKGKIDTASSKVTPDADGDVVIGGRHIPNRVDLPNEMEFGAAFQIGPRPLNFYWIDPEIEERALTEEISRRRAERERKRREAWLATGADPESPMPALEGEELAKWLEEDREFRDVKKTVRKQRKERYLAVPRRKLLIVTSLLISGPVDNAVSLESFFSQRVDRSGQTTSFTPRLGLEAEPWHDLMQLRLGSYLEPSRFSYGHPRIHGTTGLDIKVFPWTMFGLFGEDTYWRIGGVVDGARDYFSFGGSFGVWH
ncbi:MAG: hypothetical protein U0165_01495 [Polyangiaceae bacterium]